MADKTIRPLLKKLCDNYLDETKEKPKRGKQTSYERPANKYILSGSPWGLQKVSDEFEDAFDDIVEDKEIEALCSPLIDFISRFMRMFRESNKKDIRRWAPNVTKEFVCSYCNKNHEVRDFVRAILLQIIYHVEQDKKYLQFLRTSEIISQKNYDQLIKEAESEEEEEEEEEF